MWTYRQSSGEILQDGILVGHGYSGAGPCKNNPDSQCVPMQGPIPRGRYTIGDPKDTQSHGPITMTLQPAAGNEMFGRSQFLIHGDNVRLPGTASHGCIILPRPVRLAIGAGKDRALEVV